MKISKEDKDVGFKIESDTVYLFKDPVISIKLIEAIRERKRICIIENKLYSNTQNKLSKKRLHEFLDELYSCNFDFTYIYIFLDVITI
jgi:nickel-dependent lactate racemase